MSGKVSKVIVATMSPRERREWDEPRASERHGRRKRVSGAQAAKKPRERILPKHLPALAAAVCCLGVGVYAAVREGGVSEVFDHMTAGFEYDDTLGRLQFVSNILPESAMVFLSGGDEEAFSEPAQGDLIHTWSENEPWLEYACYGEVTSCADGEVTGIVRNRRDEYTVRIAHDGGYESLYSGLTGVALNENDLVLSGQRIGDAGGDAAFELRRSGLSVQPVFHAL